MEIEHVQTETHLHEAAARGRHLHVIKWLRKHSTEIIESQALDEAAAGGFSEIVEFLHAEWTEAKLKRNRRICRVSTRAMIKAAGNGHLKMVK
ncbi:unnamed protein product [Peronospora belbahrii]|uniref:Ankyrin repeat protein n=1 Tax=Peronospora belbahrii TaxID=622444 RepID=A0AAU9KWE8_9STRA|nr:unnamed protein product [Peronospora belbahrii]